MKKKYDLVFLTNLASFYKINLYNEIAISQKIYVIFISKYSEDRNQDFFKGKKFFEYTYLDENVYEQRNSIKNSIKLVKILRKIDYKKLIISGWDSLENWTACVSSVKEKNAIVVESSEFESTNRGIKGLLKKIFLSKISLAFVSGQSQKNLIKNIGFKGDIRKTKGVGIFNYEKLEIKNKVEVKNFLYVGRLSQEKNIEQLIKVFNKLPELNLNIVGYGPLESELKDKVIRKNINFLGKIDNKKLPEIYQKNDVLILPSKSEAWGLVVEEALYNGIPVILSNKVGCSTEVIIDNKHGYIYNVEEETELIERIKDVIVIDKYNMLRKNILELDFEKIKKFQINSYKI